MDQGRNDYLNGQRVLPLVLRKLPTGLCMDRSTDAQTRGHMLEVNSVMRDLRFSLSG